ncbi:hypothetical protein D3C72_575190 [compost metagenome]
MLFEHQLHAAEIAGGDVVVVDRAGNLAFHLPHQQQHVVFIEGRAVEGVEPFQRRHHAAGAGAQTRAHRQVLLQHHRQRLEAQAALLQGFPIGDPAVIEDVLLGIIRQLVGVAAHGGEGERHLCRFDLDAIPQQGAIHGGERRPQDIESHAQVGAGGRGIGDHAAALRHGILFKIGVHR